MTFSTTMRVSLCLALTGGLALAGCSGDSSGTDMGTGTDLGMGTDAGMGTDSGMGTDGGTTVCPSTAPSGPTQMGPCCYRASNATRLDTPNFRLAALKLTAPSGTISSPLIGTLLQQGFDQETFNWIIQLSGVPASGTAGSLMVKTGYGERVDATGHFQFVNGIAPTPGDVHRWDPVMTTGMIDATDNVTTMPYPGVITIPSFDSMMPSHPLLIEFPIYNLELTSMHMSEMRSCVGTRGASRWDTATMAGTISAYIRVEDARALPLNYATLTTTLCGVIAGSLSDPHYCDTATPPGTPQAMWTTKPDSMCTGTTCTTNTTGMTDVCDPATTCNAWHLLGQFDAQGVDVD